MTLDEFKAKIEQRIADEPRPRQHAAADSKFQVGDIVRYTPEFFRRVNGYADDISGEVIGVGGCLVNVRWDDGSESSVLDSNLEAPSTTAPVNLDEFAANCRRQENQRAIQSLLVAEAWSKK